MWIKDHFEYSRSVVLIFSNCLILAIMLNGCGFLNQQNRPEVESSSTGNMIVYPNEGEQFFVGDFVDIHTEISDPAGLTASVLLVNDEPMRRDQFFSSYDKGDLYQPWIPTAPGVYALQVILETTTGGQLISNIVNVYVGERQEEFGPDVELEEEVIEESLEEECPQPIATTHSYANCRSGPGTGYDIVAGLKLDQSFPVIGRSTSGIWWQVEGTAGGTCWIWEDLVEICGDTADVEVIAVQEMDQEVEEEEPEDPGEEPPPVPAEFSACHDYPDFATCTSDPMGFGGCSWDTGQSKCVP